MPLDPESIPNSKNIARKEYPNGMTVLVKENFSSPSVVIDGLVRAGAADDAPGREGLSAFTADMLMRGTQKRSFAEIYETIEAVGATVDVSSGINVTSFGTKSLTEDFALVVDVLAEVIAAAYISRQRSRKRSRRDFDQPARTRQRYAPHGGPYLSRTTVSGRPSVRTQHRRLHRIDHVHHVR